jgi:hypothetical protein
MEPLQILLGFCTENKTCKLCPKLGIGKKCQCQFLFCAAINNIMTFIILLIQISYSN